MTRVILVVESPFSQRDAGRFGVAEFTEAGLSVEVWEVCDWLLPNSRLQWHEPESGLRIESIGCESNFLAKADELGNGDFVLLLDSARAPLSSDRATLIHALTRTSAKVGAVVTGTLPPLSRRSAIWTQSYLVWKRVQRMFRPHRASPGPLDFVWADTSLVTIDRSLFGSKTRVRYIHALDFDRISGLLPHPSDAKTCLILDAMGPRHPDWVTLSMDNPWPPGLYEQIAGRVVDVLKSRGFQVIVAAHPRAAPRAMDDIYVGAEILQSDTAKLTSEASFVVVLEGSTSIGMAVALGIPVVLITHADHPRYVSQQIRRFSSALRIRPVTVEGLARMRLPPAVPKRIYESYTSKFIKRPGTTNRSFWDAVANDIMQDQLESG